jgi:flavin reductase (DIM6/NTAB) family NADH-FMN oxidoreductase RutF
MTESFDAFVRATNPAMVIVTATDGAEKAGCLVGFHAQCSIEPRRYLVCVSKANHTFDSAERASELAVHLLAADQHDLAALFGAETDDEGADKFSRCRWQQLRPGGPPVLDAVPAWFVGRVVGRSDVGDHVAFVLEPTEAGPAGGAVPLRYDAVDDLEAGHRH